jgi:5-methylcytosine-specific restriction endonuclease McrA
VKETNQNRRALLMERTRCEVARGYWNIMRSFYGSQCMSPECDATENLTLDHVVPLSKEGWHEFANWQILCKPCNSGKRDWHSEDYRPWPKLIDTKGYVKDLDRTGVVRVIEDPRDLFS